MNEINKAIKETEAAKQNRTDFERTLELERLTDQINNLIMKENLTLAECYAVIGCVKHKIELNFFRVAMKTIYKNKDNNKDISIQ